MRVSAVQYNFLPSSVIFSVYLSTLDDITVYIQLVLLQTSSCGEAEVVIFVVDKYHCIPIDGRSKEHSYHANFKLGITEGNPTIEYIAF
jgi:hypothetical protein